MSNLANGVRMVTLLATSAVCAGVAVEPAFAQVRAAFVQSVDEPGRNPYASTRFFANGFPADGSCAASFCNLQFQAVPAGKRLVVTNVIGAVYVDAPGVIAPLLLFPWANANLGTTLAIPAGLMAGTYQGSNMIGISAEVRAYFEPGAIPALAITPIGSLSALGSRGSTAITLSGYLVSIP
jgi:hypothetical protein